MFLTSLFQASKNPIPMDSTETVVCEVDPKYRNAFTNAATKVFKKMEFNLTIDTNAKKFIALNLFKMARDIANRAAEIVPLQATLKCNDIQEILPEFLSSAVLNCALASGNRYVNEYAAGLQVFKPKPPKPHKDIQHDTVRPGEQLPPALLKNGFRKLMAKVTNGCVPDKIDAGCKEILEILSTIGVYLSTHIARESRSQKIKEIDFSDVQNMLGAVLPKKLLELAVCYGCLRVKDYVKGDLKYKRIIPKAKPKTPKITSSKRKISEKEMPRKKIKATPLKKTTGKSTTSKKTISKSTTSKRTISKATSPKKTKGKLTSPRKIASKDSSSTGKSMSPKKVTPRYLLPKKTAVKSKIKSTTKTIPSKEMKIDTKKDTEQKPPEKKDTEQKPPEKKDTEQKPPEKKDTEQKPPEKKDTEQKPPEKKDTEQKLPEKKEIKLDFTDGINRKVFAMGPATMSKEMSQVMNDCLTDLCYALVSECSSWYKQGPEKTVSEKTVSAGVYNILPKGIADLAIAFSHQKIFTANCEAIENGVKSPAEKASRNIFGGIEIASDVQPLSTADDILSLETEFGRKTSRERDFTPLAKASFESMPFSVTDEVLDFAPEVDVGASFDVGGQETSIGVDLGTSTGVDLETSVGVDLGTPTGVDLGASAGVDLGTYTGVDLGTSIGVDLGTPLNAFDTTDSEPDEKEESFEEE